MKFGPSLRVTKAEIDKLCALPEVRYKVPAFACARLPAQVQVVKVRLKKGLLGDADALYLLSLSGFLDEDYLMFVRRGGKIDRLRHDDIFKHPPVYHVYKTTRGRSITRRA